MLDALLLFFFYSTFNSAFVGNAATYLSKSALFLNLAISNLSTNSNELL